ncbi:MAG: hypothetical protein LBG74_05185 [Spirochaetaceae bacterium]|nr:hypothetical protein [Spirochaetaceae bacterium]
MKNEILKQLARQNADIIGSHKTLTRINELKTGSMLFIIFLLILAFNGCETNNGKKKPPAAKPESFIQVEVEKKANTSFDPEHVPAEVKAAVQSDIVEYINELNNIIRRRDYREWIKRLSVDYQKKLNSAENLAQASKADRLKKNNIELTTLFDYFIHVVVPSRDHDRVDDIEFVNENRIKAFTLDRNSRKLRLYELERSGGSWIIVN